MQGHRASCPSCCASCLSGTVSRPGAVSSVENPYALANLLPAGTIQICVATHEICSHAHAEDGWHFFEGRSLLDHLTSSEDDSFVQQLIFLVENRFISATCQLTPSRKTLHVRIYIIPYDLANVQGKLRVRDEVKVVAPARRYLKVLLPRIIQDVRQWEGIESEGSMSGRRFLPQDIVCDISLPLHLKIQPFTEQDNRTMAEIYGDLLSPPSVPHKDIEGMESKLYGYQCDSVAAMVQKETAPTTIADPLFIPFFGLNRQKFYLQPARREILRERPLITQNRGGILCEELGKEQPDNVLNPLNPCHVQVLERPS